MWEDTFTGMLKFRARWLVRKADLPEDVASRLQTRATSQSTHGDARSTSGGVQEGDDEVFFAATTDEVDVRSIVKPIALSLYSSAATDVAAGQKDRTGPRLTHEFDDSIGDFVPLGSLGNILQSARVNRPEEVSTAPSVDREKEDAKDGKQRSCESSGWLTPIISPPAPTQIRGRRLSSSAAGIGDSDGSEVEDSSNAQDEEWEESDDSGGETTDSDMGVASKLSGSTPRDVEITPRKSARQHKFQRSPSPAPEIIATSQIPIPAAPPQTLAATLSQRRPRASLSKRQGPLPPRPRRLVMPPMMKTVLAAVGNDDTSCDASPTSNAIVSTVSARTRKSTGTKPCSSSTAPVGDVGQEPATSGKRKRGGSALTVRQSLDQSDYPPRPTAVGEAHQAEIPELMPEDKASQAPGTGTRMVSKFLAFSAVAIIDRRCAEYVQRLVENICEARCTLLVRQLRSGWVVGTKRQHGGIDRVHTPAEPCELSCSCEGAGTAVNRIIV